MSATTQTTALAPVPPPTRAEAKQSMVPIGARGLQPTDFEGVWRIASVVVASGLSPKGIETPEAAFIVIAHGLEIGLSAMQSLQSIAPINGRPCLWGDALPALVWGSGLCDHITEVFEGTDGTEGFTAVCRTKRKGSQSDTVGTFSVADAKKAGLWGKGGPWTFYPKRMLKVRARAFALRDAFADVLRGLAIAEEVQDYSETVPATVLDAPLAPGSGSFGKKRPASTTTNHQPQSATGGEADKGASTSANPATSPATAPITKQTEKPAGAPLPEDTGRAPGGVSDQLDAEAAVREIIAEWVDRRKADGIDENAARLGLARMVKTSLDCALDDITADAANELLADIRAGAKDKMLKSYDTPKAPPKK